MQHGHGQQFVSCADCYQDSVLQGGTIICTISDGIVIGSRGGNKAIELVVENHFFIPGGRCSVSQGTFGIICRDCNTNMKSAKADAPDTPGHVVRSLYEVATITIITVKLA